MIIYLHGFNSGGRSQKAEWLRHHLAPAVVFAPTYEPHRGHEAARELRKFISRLRRENPQDPRLMLIGSSLGGFWAQYLARQNWQQNRGQSHGPDHGLVAIVLINPSLRPDETLARHVGRYRNEATGGETVLTSADVAALHAYRVEPCDPRVPTLVLLDTADEVLDYRMAEAAFRGCGKTLVYPGGSHRFEHLPEALPEILALYNA
jgi:predicted esterase YcpF (UPF0227 family)